MSCYRHCRTPLAGGVQVLHSVAIVKSHRQWLVTASARSESTFSTDSRYTDTRDGCILIHRLCAAACALFCTAVCKDPYFSSTGLVEDGCMECVDGQAVGANNTHGPDKCSKCTVKPFRAPQRTLRSARSCIMPCTLRPWV